MSTQQDIDQIHILQQAEKLVSTVVRAFFDDDAVLVIDTLIREKYLKDKDDDLGARLGLQPKQVRAVLARLEREGLARQEEMLDEFSGGRKANYWYVDYRHAVNVIRLRTYLMQRRLKEAERAELARQTYACPQCGATFGVLEIQKLVNGARGFCCSHCCEMDTHETCARGPHSLRDFDNRERLATVTRALRELKEQLSASAAPGCARAGVYDLVKELHDKPVPSNLPSELRARGVGGGARGSHGASKLARFRDDRFSLHAGYAAGTKGGDGAHSSNRAVDLLYARNAAGYEVVVEIESDSDADDDGAAAAAGLSSRRAAKRKADAAAAAARNAKKAALPTFLKGSRISAADGGGDGDGGADAAAEAAATAAAAAAAPADNEEQRRALYHAELARQQARLGAENGGSGGAQPAAATAAAAAAAIAEGTTDTEEDVDWEAAADGEMAAAGGGAGEVKLPPPSSGVTFEVDGAQVPLEWLTAELIGAMSAEQYRRYYALTAAAQR